MKKTTLFLISTAFFSCANKEIHNGLSVNSKSINFINDKTKMNGDIKSIQDKHYDVIEESKINLTYSNGVKYNKFGSIVGVLNDGVWLDMSIKYNDNHNEIETSFFIDNSLVKNNYSYDENGNNTLDESEFKKRVFEYDDKMNLIKEEKYDEKHLVSIYKYNYDSKGNIIEENVFTEENVFKSKHKYKYDNKGNVTEDSFFDTPEHEANTRKYTYEVFDFKGNWTKRIEKSNYPEIIKREIIYY